jgi:glutathione peroxidase-family protein
LTKQNYQELPKLHDEYRARGLKILAFPCNQFGAQEPGTADEILEFVAQFDPKMAEKLVFFEKADVNGAQALEVFSFLKAQLPNPDQTLDIRWNFGKRGVRWLIFPGSIASANSRKVFLSLQVNFSSTMKAHHSSGICPKRVPST